MPLADGRVYFGEQSVSFAEIGQAAYLHPERLPVGEEPALEASAVYQPGRSTGAFSYATHTCVLAVDPGTGHVEVLDYVVCHDCGTMVNPMIVEGQVVGGVAQGSAPRSTRKSLMTKTASRWRRHFSTT